ncbi:hypothetical protein F4778DRAFT_765671 [Xylariomycetidae sp. FL2044]|nr:hypothetical protein F4778DRAFT_765671 [Xylariomycetidae sp. FL2044]
MDEKALWDRSRDASSLRFAIESGIKNDMIVGVDKIVCFDLGSMSSTPPHPEDDPGKAALTKKLNATNRSRHAAAITIADVMSEIWYQGIQNIPIYAQSSRYVFEDEEILNLAGIQVLSYEFGFQEGFVKVDNHTFVFSVGQSGCQQVIMETTRPAGMLWEALPGSMYCKQLEWKEHLFHEYVLFRHPYTCQPWDFSRRPWEEGKESDIVGEAGAPMFGVERHDVEEDTMTDMEKLLRLVQKQRGVPPLLRKPRYLQGTELYVPRKKFRNPTASELIKSDPWGLKIEKVDD